MAKIWGNRLVIVCLCSEFRWAEAAPPGENTLLVKNFRVTGNTLLAEDQLQALLQPFEGKALTHNYGIAETGSSFTANQDDCEIRFESGFSLGAGGRIQLQDVGFNNIVVEEAED